MQTHDYAVIGGGIIGLSVAMHLQQRHPGRRVVVLEKENSPALHQTGRNSGVIHSGIYYKPGSFKARFATAGARSMVAFCEENGIPHEVCGKIIIATEEHELPLLESLHQRGLQNGVPVEKMAPEQVREVEPHVRCLAGLSVKSTGSTDYVAVCRTMLARILAGEGEVHFNREVHRITDSGGLKVIESNGGEIAARFLVNCAGLHSDRVARMSGDEPGLKIVPFRGEYYELVPGRRHLVNTLVYPVPNPDFPFLGVHFTKMIDGSVHAGPNAVLAFKREGYRKTDFSLRDLAGTLAFPGFWKLACRNLGEGMKEMHRSFFKSAFVRSLQRLVPEVGEADLVPCKAGVRAQALFDDGRLVDDFHLVESPGALHVCNAPSPAATASLEIGRSVAERLG